MNINEITKNLLNFKTEIKNKIDADADSLHQMVEEICEDSVNINSGQGLTTFLETRKRIMSEIERLRFEYQYLLCNYPIPK